MKKDTKEWLKKNPSLQRFENKHPLWADFFKHRLSKNERFGRRFTGGLALSLVFFLIFLEVMFDVVSHEVTALDQSITNFIYIFRNLAFAKYFLFFTDIGDFQGVLVFAAVFIIILIILGRKREALFSAFTLFLGEVSYSLIKIIIARPRPSIFYALVPRTGFSFPSGHSVGSIVFYVFTSYLLSRLFKEKTAKALFWLAGAFIALNIGLSRIYLGVHWTSDVLGGWSLGLAIAIFSASLLRAVEGKDTPKPQPVFSKKAIYQITAGLLALAIVFVLFFYEYNPLEYKVQPLPTQPTFLSATSTATGIISMKGFPKFSESIAGDPMEPLSFVVIGSESKLVSAFESEGWVVADPPTTANFLKLAEAAVFGKPYPKAPASPSFINAEPQLITFEKDVGGTFIVRHHTRFWKTNFYYGSEPVWVASASFDQGLEKYLVYHRISPAIDTERDYINSDLLASGLVESETEVQMVPPMMGHNFAGDPFFTNGKAYVIFLK